MTAAGAPYAGARVGEYRRGSLVFDVVDGGPLDGERVVLLHGFPERASSWEAVAALLQAEGLRTLAPDQRGYSPRARPATRWSYRFPELVADVAALVEQVGGPVHVVGHDWGAAVAWGLADRRPDLVRTLTAVSVPHPRAMLRASLHGPQLARSWYVLPFNVPGLLETLTRARPDFFDVPLRKGGMRAEDVERVHREILEDGALPGALGWYRGAFLSPPRVGRIRVPTTYVWSDRDVALSREAAEACGDFVDADYELVVLEGMNHWIPRQAPEALTAAVLARIRSVG
ncbi:alpha/beta fold hydrolase [Nocardioides solisilvae]|uniref:alpha/beta fold hydrolase n=1 Tax=Nocardioides solisilvae TaxID=1542435 RepID=UPI000D74ABC7|nr:alpha/beta fold hydrolase [Nocardioides solisilvae]